MNPSIQDTFGWVLFMQGNGKKGLELLAQAAAGAPRSADIRLHYAKALLASGDKAGASKELQAVSELGKGTALEAEARRLLQAR